MTSSTGPQEPDDAPGARGGSWTPRCSTCCGPKGSGSAPRRADATVAEWQELLDDAMALATSCAETYCAAEHASRRLYNSVVFERIRIASGKVENYVLRPPFDLVLAAQVKASLRTSSNTGGLAGEEGFEPSNGGSKVRCLTTWRLPSGRWRRWQG